MTLFHLAPFARVMSLLDADDMACFVVADPYTRTMVHVDALDPHDRATLLTWEQRTHHKTSEAETTRGTDAAPSPPGTPGISGSDSNDSSSTSGTDGASSASNASSTDVVGKPASAALQHALACRECDAMCCGVRHGAVWKHVGTFAPDNDMFRIRVFVATCVSAYKVRRHPGGVVRFAIGAGIRRETMGIIGRCALAATIHDPTGRARVMPLEPANVKITWFNHMATRDWLTAHKHVLRSPCCVACSKPRASHLCPDCNLAWYCSAECMHHDRPRHLSCKIACTIACPIASAPVSHV